MQQVVFQDLGLINFKEAWDYQEKLFQEIIDIKVETVRKEQIWQHNLTFYFANTQVCIRFEKSGNEKSL